MGEGYRPQYLIISSTNITDLQEEMNENADYGWSVVTTDIRPPMYVATMVRMELTPQDSGKERDDANKKVSKRHNWMMGMGMCICDQHSNFNAAIKKLRQKMEGEGG